MQHKWYHILLLCSLPCFFFFSNIFTDFPSFFLVFFLPCSMQSLFFQLQMHRKKYSENLFFSINSLPLISWLFSFFFSLTFLSLFIHYYFTVFSFFLHFSHLSHVNNIMYYYLWVRFPLCFFLFLFSIFLLYFHASHPSWTYLSFPILFFCFPSLIVYLSPTNNSLSKTWILEECSKSRSLTKYWLKVISPLALCYIHIGCRL